MDGARPPPAGVLGAVVAGDHVVESAKHALVVREGRIAGKLKRVAEGSAIPGHSRPGLRIHTDRLVAFGARVLDGDRTFGGDVVVLETARSPNQPGKGGSSHQDRPGSWGREGGSYVFDRAEDLRLWRQNRRRPKQHRRDYDAILIGHNSTVKRQTDRYVTLEVECIALPESASRGPGHGLGPLDV